MPPQCGAFSRDLQDKSQSPRYSPGVGGPWLQMTSALSFLLIQVSITSNTVGEGSPMRLSGLSELLAVDRGRPVFIDPPTLRGSSLGVLPV